jgi:hypothetical protein
MSRRIFVSLGGACALALLGAPPVLAQCALCRDAAASAPPGTREAMNVAIIGLAMAPYVVGAFAAWMLLPGLRARIRARFRAGALRSASGPS